MTSKVALATLLALIVVNTATAQMTVTGVIRAEEEVIVRSEFPGIVQRIAVKEGERVREGQLLLEMKNDRQKIVLDLARAGESKAMALVEETKVVLANAEKDFDRVKIAATALPRMELENREDQVLRLKANLGAQMGDLAQAREEVRLREQELRETQLFAPFSGTVTEIFINRGDSLKPMETQVLELVDLEELYAEVLLPSSYIQKVKQDQRVRVQVESEWMGRQGEVEGRVIFINPTVDASSRTFSVKIRIPHSNASIRPGLLVQARFE